MYGVLWNHLLKGSGSGIEVLLLAEYPLRKQESSRVDLSLIVPFDHLFIVSYPTLFHFTQYMYKISVYE
jgi:hypothetical protein